MKPEQPADRSNAAARRALRASWMMQALAGIGRSGVTVAQITKSRSAAAMPAAISASRAARVANRDIGSSSPAMRRSRIPVRVAIHSSEVSTILSRSPLVSTLSGRADPVPRITARRPARLISFPRRHGQLAGRLDARLARLARRHLRHGIADAVIHVVSVKVKGHADGVLDGARRGTSVTNDRRSLHPQERHTPVLGIVDLLAKPPERRAGQEVPEPRPDRLPDLLPQEMENRLGGAFDRLQRDVADEAVADNDVGLAIEDIAPFNVADEVEGRLLQDPEGLPCDLVALGVLLADTHQPDARIRNPQGL